MQKEILSFSKMHVEGDQVITATHDELLMKDGRVLKDTMSGLWNVTPVSYTHLTLPTKA